MRSPGRTPAVSPSGTVSSVPSRKPTTCTGRGGSPGAPVISQISPTLARGPADSISRPTLRITRPDGGMVSTCPTRAMWRASENPSGADNANPRVLGGIAEQGPRDFLDLCVGAGVHHAEIRLDAAAAAADPRVGDDGD